MRRVIPNIIDEAQIIAGRGDDGALARYGADLLGRAIGREQRHDADPAGWAALICAIRMSGAFTITQQILVHQAMTEVMAGA